MKLGIFIVLMINFVLMYLFSGSIYFWVGIIYTIISIVLTLTLKNSQYSKVIIKLMVKSWNEDVLQNKEDENMILLSVAFLIGSMKIGAAIAIFVEVSAILFIALAILIATGFFVEGYGSGMTLGGAYNLGKWILKIGQFLFLFLDKVMGWIMDLIVKIEFSILRIEKR